MAKICLKGSEGRMQMRKTRGREEVEENKLNTITYLTNKMNTKICRKISWRTSSLKIDFVIQLQPSLEFRFIRGTKNKLLFIMSVSPLTEFSMTGNYIIVELLFLINPKTFIQGNNGSRLPQNILPSRSVDSPSKYDIS